MALSGGGDGIAGGVGRVVSDGTDGLLTLSTTGTSSPAFIVNGQLFEFSELVIEIRLPNDNLLFLRGKI